MANIGERIQRAIEEMTGNEALLEMLDTDAAMQMLEWGKTLAASVIQKTEGLDDLTADLAVLPRLKAVRQFMRSAGNWAAGKYTDPATRVTLRDKMLQYLSSILGENASLPPAEKMDAVLSEVDNKDNTPLQLILKLKTTLQEMSF
jgi:hypothetical protein